MHELFTQIIQDNWQEKLDLNALSQDDLVEILADFKDMERFTKKVTGYLKEAESVRVTQDDYTTPHNVRIVRNHRTRKGGLDREAILEEMGEEWVEDHSLPDIEYTELRVSRIKDGED